MKFTATPPAVGFRFSQNPYVRTKCKSLTFPLLALVAGFLLATNPVRASNVLVNPGFEANSGHLIPIGWTYFSPPTPSNYFGDYWVESAVAAHSGTFYWKEWGALYLPAPTNNVAGIYQDISGTPGSAYQASG